MPLSTDPEYDDFFEPLNLDIEDLQKLDAVIENDYRRMGAASKSPSPVAELLVVSYPQEALRRRNLTNHHPHVEARHNGLLNTRPTAKSRSGITLRLRRPWRRQGRKGKLKL